MTQYSFSFDGKHWADNEAGIDWECSRCKARFPREDDAMAHIQMEHGSGTVYPRLNAVGLKGFQLWGSARGLGQEQLAAINEPTILSLMGAKSRAVQEDRTSLIESEYPELASLHGQLVEPNKNSTASAETGSAPALKLPGSHAVMVGVGDYEHQRFANLPATVRDVRALTSVLLDPERGNYRPENVHTITGPDATAANIRGGLERLAKSTNCESTVLVYFSGHGGRASEDGHWRTYLCPREANPYDIANTAISGDELTAILAAIPARRLLVVIDACHAGGSAQLKAGDGTTIWKSGLPENYYEALSQGSGRVVIASSKTEQYSHVRHQGDLSLFTYHLRDALNGKAAVRGDGLVHVLDVFHYVNEAVQADQPDQTPILKVNDLDLNFPIAAAPAEVSAAPKTSEVVREVETIREQIVRDPVAGANALSQYLENHPDLAAKRNEVDLKRSQLEQIQHDLDLFGPDPSKKAEKNRVVFFLLRVCLKLERAE